MIAQTIERRPERDRQAFTLVELLVVIAIIAILASTALFAMYGVREDVREKSTRATVAQISELIFGRVEEYRVRPLPIRIPARTSPLLAAELRLLAVRQLMRMEVPDRVTDVVDGPAPIDVIDTTVVPPVSIHIDMPSPSLWLAYRRRAEATLGSSWPALWTTQYQGAECLYMILAAIRDNDRTGLDGISESLIGDVDGDRMPEILDAWGQPIEFLRWAPGFASTLQTRNAVDAPDLFDPLHVDYRWHDAIAGNEPFVLYPLIFSPGRDHQYDIATGFIMNIPGVYNGDLRYSLTTPYPNDPYYTLGGTMSYLGEPFDRDGDGFNNTDNITNHLLN
jgi:prepilin-type N-terminal cleavage/methylation domain-containing protein